MDKNYALITGGSSGIGFEIARDLAKRGYNIILVSRNEQNLQDSCKHLSEEFNVSSDYISSDLANKETVRHIYQTTKERGYNVEILINNAGYGIASPFHETSLEDEEKFVRVLATSVISLTKLFVRDMVEMKAGKIMIVSSVAAFAPPSAIQVLY
ncbi:MAG TPA: SDR family NAD(P)-dependent oxidoreductase, partial [Gammaproteobacteria bacterium]|nr:SDR family NAD(P)-dependent oxidoreductase [Gammaproteobacteria bacterium]